MSVFLKDPLYNRSNTLSFLLCATDGAASFLSLTGEMTTCDTVATAAVLAVGVLLCGVFFMLNIISSSSVSSIFGVFFASDNGDSTLLPGKGVFLMVEVASGVDLAASGVDD